MMTKTIVTLVVLVLVTVVGVGVYSGKLTAWSGIVATDVENRIDELLGRERVMRQQALDAIHAARTDIARLQELVVSSTVDAELMAERIARLRVEEEEAQKQLGRLAAMIEQGQPIELHNGTRWEVSDLEAYAKTKIVEFETIQQRLATYTEGRRIHQETAARAQTALTTAQQNVANMEASLELLDAKIGLLQTLQTQPDRFARGSSATAGYLADTEGLLDTLVGEVEREIRIAQERSTIQRSTPLGSEAEAPLPSANGALVDQLYTLSGLEKE